MNSTGWAALIVVVLLVAGGAWWYAAKPGTESPSAPNPAGIVEEGIGVEEGPASGSPEGAGASAPMTATVTYSDSGFSPAAVTIRKGGSVTWINDSSGAMWVASAQHPTHTAYNGTSRQDHCGSAQESTAFDQCRGETGDWTFTFDKTGTWAYHDHVNASRFGRVEVVE